MSASPFLTSCPHCGREHDFHSGVAGSEGKAPRSGDVSFCWGCREVAVYSIGPLGSLVLRKPTPPEARRLADDPRVRAVRAAASESYNPNQAIALVALDDSSAPGS